MIQTTRGERDEESLTKIVGFEIRPDTYVLYVRWFDPADNELIRAEAYPLQKPQGPMVLTTKGYQPISRISTSIKFVETEGEYIITPERFIDGEFVGNDVHVVKKKASEFIGAVAGGIGK